MNLHAIHHQTADPAGRRSTGSPQHDGRRRASRRSRHAWVAVATVLVALLACGATAQAQTLNLCSAKKKGCVAKKAKALLKCHAKAEKKGEPLDFLCIQKAEDKFDGGADPTKGCFEKLEAKGGCLTLDDTAALEAKVDAFVLDVVTSVDPGYPAAVLNLCSAKKKGCIAKKTQALLKCHAKAEKKGVFVDPLCVQKAEDKFDGGADPTKGCFEKLEAKPPCLTLDDTAALEAKIDAFVQDVVCELDPAAPGCACPTTYTFTVTGTSSDEDLGPTALGHDADLPSTSRLTFNLGSCTNGTPPCGDCAVSGPVANPGGAAFANRRCRGADVTGASGSWISCTSDAECPGTGNACVFFLGPPQPIGVGGVPVCATNEIGGSVAGTVNVETGSTGISLPWRLRMGIGFDIPDPCPRCVGGLCSGGPRDGQTCTVNGSSAVFGDALSLDCPPPPPTVEQLMNVPLTTGAQTEMLSAASPACSATGFTALKCPCDVCDNAASTPCRTSADCVAVGATTCGGRHCAPPSTNLGQLCTASSECVGGLCAVVGQSTQPNPCDDGACTPNTPPDNDSSDEGECAAGPFDGYCAIETYRGCVVASDCPASGDSCTFPARQCFTLNGALGNDVSASGVTSPTTPTLAGLFCMPPTVASSFNTAFGFPGLGRLTIPGTASFN
jgi:hypothetical protein